jgi:hypothetical protein
MAFSKNWIASVVSLGEPFTVDFLNRAYGNRKVRVLTIDDTTGATTLGAVGYPVSAPGGISGPLTVTIAASATIAASSAVYVSGNNTVATASATDATKLPIGVTVHGCSSGSKCLIVKGGSAKGVLTSATAGTPYYLSTTGTLTTTPPSATGNVDIVMGIALNATDLHVQIMLGPIVTHA